MVTRVLRRLDAQVEGSEEFGREELPDPLDPDALHVARSTFVRSQPPQSRKRGALDLERRDRRRDPTQQRWVADGELRRIVREV
jgi:hypothetical protein